MRREDLTTFFKFRSKVENIIESARTNRIYKYPPPGGMLWLRYNSYDWPNYVLILKSYTMFLVINGDSWLRNTMRTLAHLSLKLLKKH